MGRVKDATYWRDYRARRAARGDPVRRNKPSRRKHTDFAFSDVLMTLVLDEVERLGVRGFSRAVLLDHSVVSRWMSGNRLITWPVDVLVDYFGWERIRTRRAALRELMATTGDSVDPADTGRLTTPWLPREVNREPKRHPWKASIRG